MKLGFGALDDTVDERDKLYPARDLVGATPVKTLAMELIPHVYVDKRLGWCNQHHSSACVGYAITQTIWTYLSSLGIKQQYGSPIGLYFHAIARSRGWHSVTDDGSQPRHAWESIRELGLIPFSSHPIGASSWGDVAARVCSHPAPDCYRQAIDMDWIRYHWIMSYGAECKREMQQTLSSGRPFAASFTLGEDFFDWQLSNGPYRRKSKVAGYHYMPCVGYDQGGVWCANSHGIGFGQMGYVLISWDTMVSVETRSKAVPDVNLPAGQCHA